MREVLSSGCPPIKLDNGAAVCNPSNRQCRVVCRFGHTMAGFGVAFKVCNIITGNWMPQPIPRYLKYFYKYDKFLRYNKRLIDFINSLLLIIGLQNFKKASFIYKGQIKIH